MRDLRLIRPRQQFGIISSTYHLPVREARRRASDQKRCRHRLKFTMRHLTKNIVARLLLVVLLGSAANGVADDSHDPHPTMPRLLVMAAISDNPMGIHEAMQPMADYMGRKLAPIGIESVKIIVVENHEQMVLLLHEKKVDWITETAYSAALLQRRGGAETLVRRWKQGVPDYRSVVFTRKSRDIQGLDDLVNRRIAFQHRGSTTGYFVVASALKSAGYRLQQLGSVYDQPAAGELGYVFSGAEYNSAIWVHKGIVDAGVVSSIDWQQESILPEKIREDMRIIYTSPPIPRALELVRGDLNPVVKAAMKQALLTAHLDPEASTALAAYQGTSKFDALDGDAVAALQLIDAAIVAETSEPVSAP